jgi:hypothetical protein
MKRQSQPDQNELMIVNPGRQGNEESLSLDQLYFGEDGNVYQVQGLEEDETFQGLNEFYLGEDGALYSLESPGAFSHYFLGEDGTLYEVI